MQENRPPPEQHQTLHDIDIQSEAQAFKIIQRAMVHIGGVIPLFCAAIPNFRIMEFGGDDVPRNDDLVTHPPVVKEGELMVPARPGWGCDVNEEAVRAHPPKHPR